MRGRFVAALLVSVVAFVGMPGGVAQAQGGLASTDQEKRDDILQILENYQEYVQDFWVPDDANMPAALNVAEPNTGTYNAAGVGVTQSRGAAAVALVLATLLVERPNQASFGGFPRAVLQERAIQTIRNTALHNIHVMGDTAYDWGGAADWQAPLETVGWAFAAKLLDPYLDQATRDLVATVVTAEADILVGRPSPGGGPGNTGAEEAAWSVGLPALAATLYPDDPRADDWHETALRLAYNTFSTPADEQDSTLMDGEPLSHWIETANLNSDLTAVNHNFFNPVYQQANAFEGAWFYAYANKPLPQAFAFRVEDVWERVLGGLVADDGDLIMPVGQEWGAKDWGSLQYYAMVATQFGRADASVAESRAIDHILARQTADNPVDHWQGAVLGGNSLGYDANLMYRYVEAYWAHREFGPSPTPTQQQYDDARAETSGLQRHPDVNVVNIRQPKGTMSMAWHPDRTTGLVIPAATGHEGDRVFSSYLPGSLIGGATGSVGPTSCDCRDDFFSTAGTVGARRFSMTAFPDGVALLLDQGTGATFNLSVARVNGLAPDRTVYTQDGPGLGDKSGNWINVGDRLGIAVAGGGGVTSRDGSEQGTIVNLYREIVGSRATGSGNRGAVVLSLADHQTTAAVAGELAQPTVPSGWSALTAGVPDGSMRLALARWDGPGSATLAISDDRGAPVTEAETTLSGDTAAFEQRATSLPYSSGQILRYFVDASAPLEGRLVTEHQALLTAASATTVAVTYVAANGVEHTASQSIPAGATVLARMEGGVLTLTRVPQFTGATIASNPASLMGDGNAGTWAISSANPTAGAPVLLGVDQLLPSKVVGIRMTPRSSQGPRAYTVETSSDGTAWTTRGRVYRASASLATTTTLPVAIEARHVRLRITEIHGVSGAQIAELELLHESEPPARRYFADTAAAPYETERMGDGSAATFWVADGPGPSATTPVTFGVDLGESLPLADVSVTPRPQYGPKTYRIETSADGQVWTERAAVATAAEYVPTATQLPAGVTARYVRIVVTHAYDPAVQPSRGVQVAELRVTPRPTYFADSYAAPYVPANLGDGLTSTFWVGGSTPSTTAPVHVGVDAGEPRTVGAVTITPRSVYGPEDYTVETSSDGIVWDTRATVTDAAQSAPTTVTFSPVQARYLRLRITASYDPLNRPVRSPQIAELSIAEG